MTANLQVLEKPDRPRENDMNRYCRQLWSKTGVPRRFQSYRLDTWPVSTHTRAMYEWVVRWWDGPPDEEGVAAWNTWRRQRRVSLLLYGPCGTGKTSLAVGLLREHVLTEEPGMFMTTSDLLDAIRATYDAKAGSTERAVIDQVKRTPFLVLDDIGAERVTDWAREKLFTIINYRHGEDLPTVFTSNLGTAELAEHIGERTMWRIVEMCEIVGLDGPNQRDRLRPA